MVDITKPQIYPLLISCLLTITGKDNDHIQESLCQMLQLFKPSIFWGYLSAFQEVPLFSFLWDEEQEKTCLGHRDTAQLVECLPSMTLGSILSTS